MKCGLELCQRLKGRVASRPFVRIERNLPRLGFASPVHADVDDFDRHNFFPEFPLLYGRHGSLVAAQ